MKMASSTHDASAASNASFWFSLEQLPFVAKQTPTK
jgi:hypothetical protein